MLRDPITVTGTPVEILPPGVRVGYRLTVKSGVDVAFGYGPTASTRLTFVRGDTVANGQTVVQTDERIVRHGVWAVTNGGSASVSCEEFN